MLSRNLRFLAFVFSEKPHKYAVRDGDLFLPLSANLLFIKDSDNEINSNMKKCIRRKQSVVVYPESRHCNAGTTSYLPDHLGQLAKYLNVPVVILSAHGSYLESPFWDEEYSRKAPITAKLECLYTKDELINASEEEIQEKVARALQYDEYAWQQNNKIYLKRNRANGLHKVLYRCPRCNGMDSVNHDTERDMMPKTSAVMSAGTVNQVIQCNIRMGSIMTASDQEGVQCKLCGAKWKLTPLGELEYIRTANKDAVMEEHSDDGKERSGHDGYHKKEFRSIPSWYEWERSCAIDEWNSSNQEMVYSVRVEALPNSKGFIDCGSGTLVFDQDAFILTFADQRLVFPHRIRESVQTEYNYKGKGMCIVLSTQDNCYYIYSEDSHFNPTWMQFVGEYLYQQSKKCT